MADTPNADFLEKYGKFLEITRTASSFIVVIPGIISAYRVPPLKSSFDNDSGIFSYLNSMISTHFSMIPGTNYSPRLHSFVELSCTKLLYGAGVSGPAEDQININIKITKDIDASEMESRFGFELLESIVNIKKMLNDSLFVDTLERFGFTDGTQENSAHYDIPTRVPNNLLYDYENTPRMLK